MSEPPVIGGLRCIHCGAAMPSLEKACWLCGAKPSVNPYEASRPENYWTETSPLRFTVVDYLFTLLLIGSALLTILIVIGMSINDRGMIIPFLVVVSPAFIATAVKGLAQWRHTGRADPGKLVVTMLVTGLATAGLIGVLALAGIALLFAICISQLSR